MNPRLLPLVASLCGSTLATAAAAGRAHLKTGSRCDVAGVAGYVLGASGQRDVLVAVTDPADANAAKAALDALVLSVIADAPRMRRPAEPSRKNTQ